MNKNQLEIDTPTLRRQFQMLLDGMGLHDAVLIPVEVAFRMFEAFYNYAHNWNVNLQHILDEYNRLYLPRTLQPKGGER